MTGAKTAMIKIIQAFVYCHKNVKGPSIDLNSDYSHKSTLYHY